MGEQQCGLSRCTREYEHKRVCMGVFGVCSECARAGPDGAALLWSRAGLEDGTLGGDSVVLGLLELL